MDSHSNKVLITGINGFTGKYLTDYLTEKGFVVFGISNDSQNLAPTIFHCDILNKESLTSVLNQIKPDYIIHLAAISFVGYQNIAEMYEVNVVGTQNILDVCVELKLNQKKIILASSATVYGNQKESVLTETMNPNPVNHYGISKLAMELMAKNYFHLLPIIITRPFNYTAPGQAEHFVIPKIAKAFNEKAKKVELGNLDVYREYNSIEFICESYLRLLQSNQKSEIVNLASNQTYSLKEIIALFENFSKHKIQVEVNPLFVRKNEIIKLSGCSEKLKSIVKHEITNDIEKVVKSFLKNKTD